MIVTREVIGSLLILFGAYKTNLTPFDKKGSGAGKTAGLPMSKLLQMFAVTSLGLSTPRSRNLPSVSV